MNKCIIAPFETKEVSTPWNDQDIEEYKRNGSQRDRIFYNKKINARFSLETEEEPYVYQVSIKRQGKTYRNFSIVPITFNRFFIVAYLPRLTSLHKVTIDPVIQNLLSKFPLLSDSVKSLNSDSGIFISQKCKIMGDFLYYDVNAPITQLLFPLNDNIVNTEILNSYKTLSLIYEQIENEIEEFIELGTKAYETLNKKINKILEQVELERREKINKFLTRTAIRISISTAIAVASGGILVDIDGAYNIMESIEELSALSDIAKISDLLCNLGIDSFDMVGFDMPILLEPYDFDSINFDISTDPCDLDSMEFDSTTSPNDLEPTEDGSNVIFGKDTKKIGKTIYTEKKKVTITSISGNKKSITIYQKGTYGADYVFDGGTPKCLAGKNFVTIENIKYVVNSIK